MRTHYIDVIIDVVPLKSSYALLTKTCILDNFIYP